MSKPLTPAQQAHAEAMRAAVHQHCPELLPQIRELTQLGLIDGWRSVVSVLDCGPPRPLNTIDAATAIENSQSMHTLRGKS